MKRKTFLTKFTGILLTAVLVLSPALLTGCGNSSAEEEPVVLTLALREGTYADVVMSCLPAFEEKTGYQCVVHTLSEDDLHALLRGQAVQGIPEYDVCMADSSWTAELMAKNRLANLSELGYSPDNDIIPATTRIAYHEGDMYLTPYYGNMTVLMYNRDLVTRSGYSGSSLTNLDDILDAAQKVQGLGKNGFVYRGDTENNLVVDFLPILLSYGGWVVDQNNNPTVDTENFANALNYYLELIHTGTAMPKADLIESIDSGESALAIAWPGWYTPDSTTPANYCALTGRVSSNSISFNANVYGICMLGVNSESKNPAASVELITYLMDKDVQRSTIDLGGVPCRYSSLQDDQVLATHPQYDAVCKALQGGTYRPVMEEWTTFYTVLGPYLQQIFDGELEVNIGLKQAQKALENAMKYGLPNESETVETIPF